MPRRMIPVQHRETGEKTTVSEQAYGYFAAHYKRLDQPAEQSPEAPAADKPGEPAPRAPEGDSNPATPTARPTAPKTTKE